MLKKLLRYDLTATGRLLLPIYGLIVLLSLFLRLFDFLTNFIFTNELLNNIISKLYMFLLVVYIFGLFAISFLTLFICIQRFYQSVNKNDAYLLFTLPVPRSYHILTKLITAVIWFVMSIVTVFASLFVIFFKQGFFDDVKYYFNFIMDFLIAAKVPTAFLAFESIVLLFVNLVSSILMIFTAISIGQVISKRRLLGSIGGYFILNIANQILSVIVLTIFTGITGADSLEINGTVSYVMAFLGLLIVFYSCLSVAYFFITNKILKTRLNLES